MFDIFADSSVNLPDELIREYGIGVIPYSYVMNGEVHTMADEAYTSHNTRRLDVEGTVEKILTTDYVQDALKTV